MAKWKFFRSDSSLAASGARSGGSARSNLPVLRKGHAMRVIFFYPGEEGTYIDNASVTVYENGIVHLKSALEETTTHLQNCEILWTFKNEAEDRNSPSKIRLLKSRNGESEDPSKNPELR
ncbi:MAG: hypothetical protein KGQ59_01055 [Bdellovibrionales bacterium]|nr:hypothetical protein [Bdellovibrionales bacterium]